MDKEGRNRKNEERDKKIETFVQRNLSAFFIKIKLDILFNKVFRFADAHRKLSFFLLNFTLLVVVVLMLSLRNHPDAYKASFQSLNTDSIKANLSVGSKFSTGIEDYFQLKEIENELVQLQQKKVITPEDTTRIKELYKILTSKNKLHGHKKH